MILLTSPFFLLAESVGPEELSTPVDRHHLMLLHVSKQLVPPVLLYWQVFCGRSTSSLDSVNRPGE